MRVYEPYIFVHAWNKRSLRLFGRFATITIFLTRLMHLIHINIFFDIA